MSGFFAVPAVSSSQISFGSNAMSAAVVTYLWPGNELEQLSQILQASQPVRVPPGKTGKLSQLRLIAGAGPVGASSTFTVLKNSPGDGNQTPAVATSLVVVLPVAGNLVSDDINEVAILDGDEISIRHNPGVGQTTGPGTYVLGVLSVTIQ